MKRLGFVGSAMMLGLALSAIILLSVWLTGGTFGQRCERLHPNADALTLERCVYDLSHGTRP